MARMLGQLLNSVPDRTNAPAEAESPQEWATRVGQEHDTWHRTDSEIPPPSGPPVITGFDPEPLRPGQVAAPLRVLGTGFVDGSVVEISYDLPTTFVSATELHLASYTAPPIAGDLQVRVKNPDGQWSGFVGLTIEPAPTTAVTLTSITPSSTPWKADVTIVAIGTGFTNTGDLEESIMIVGGEALYPLDFISDTEVHYTVNDPAWPAGVRDVIIRNGSDVSNALPLTIVQPPVPTITSLDPASLTMAAGATTFNINGTGFLPGMSVNVAGQGISHTFVVVSDTLITGVPFHPPGVGNYNIYVQTGGNTAGKSNTVALAVTA
jgi:hypothetical protein